MERPTRLLVVYPSCNIDVNPTMTHLLESLAARRVEVDVLLEEAGDYSTPAPYGPGIRLMHLPSAHVSLRGTSLEGLPKRVLLKLLRANSQRAYRVAGDLAFFPYLRARRYDAVLGVDPAGLAVAARLNRVWRRPLAYLSFEIFFNSEVTSEEEKAIKRAENAACRDTALALIQDEERAEMLSRETGLPREKMALVPVAPLPRKVAPSDYLRRTLGVPADHRIVLYFGSVRPWTGRDELAEMVDDWPAQYCLVIHSSSRLSGRVSPDLRRLMDAGRIYFSTEPISREGLHDLVASADFGLAPYKPVADAWDTGPNVYHLGLSSGKVAFYSLCGLPILARALPVFEREFARYDCGRVYRRISETGALLAQLDQDYTRHSAEARRFYRERLDPSGPLHQFCDRLLDLAAQSASPRHAAPVALPRAASPRSLARDDRRMR